MEIKNVSILGCGWFGLPFAKHLVSKGYRVKGSTTSETKLGALTAAGIAPFLIDLNQNIGLPADFFNTEILLLNVPPKAKSANASNYIDQLKLIAEAAKGQIKHLVFISSTGVFEDGNFEVNEHDSPSPNTEAGKIIAAAEDLWQHYTSFFSVTIVRFAGLIGPGRNLAKFFAGKTDIANGKAPVNLITLDDCIGFCSHLLATQKFGLTYHAVVPHHPTREEFYTKLAAASGMEKPHFKNELLAWKQINSVNVPEKLGYSFKVKHWFEWMQQPLSP